MATALFEPAAPDVVYLVDLSSYLLRAYHAVAPLTSPSGEPTHAVHGTVTMIERLLRERKPQLFGICMDAGRDTFRKEIYGEYKATRPPAPEDLRSQIGRAEQIVRASGYAVFKQQGVEADDLLATITRRAIEQGLRVVIVGADKDLMQLVSERVVLWDTLRNKVFGIPEVEERFGVGPDRLGDLLALMGDSSDNIPGVPSVGPKTAAELLTTHGSLDGIFSSLAAIQRKKLRETLTEHEAAARLSRRLVALKDDCELDATRRTLSITHVERRDPSQLRALYTELGFSRQLAALERSEGAPASPAPNEARSPATASVEPANANTEQLQANVEADTGPSAHQASPVNVEVVLDEAALETLVAALGEGTWALELYAPRPFDRLGPVIGAAFSGPRGSYYLPLGHRSTTAPRQLGTSALVRVLDAAGALGPRLVVHDLKQVLVLARAAASVELERAFDLHLASYLLDPERNHGLSAIADRIAQPAPEIESVLGQGRRRITFDELDVTQAAVLGGARTRAMREARRELGERLAELHLERLLDDMERPLAAVLADLERAGVLVDVDRLGTLGEAAERELARLEGEAHRAAGKTFNVSSPRQLETILFDELGLRVKKRTKTSRSTDAETLEALEDEHPLPGIILEHRKIAKLKGTYMDALPALVSAATGRVHSAWEQAVAATGRISSTDPNLQNIPIRSELGREIRGAFVAPPGTLLVSADYSQIELRVLAHLSEDERLLEAFRTGQDIHTRTAMEIFEVDEAGVTRELRTRAKAVNFGVIYGQGESGLSRALGIEKSVAASFIEAYFRRYSGVREFMQRTLEGAREGEMVTSLLGRRRLLPDIKSGNRQRRLAAERIAMNMPIQGSAADILKLAMLRLRAPVVPGSRMVLTVHDELVFEVPIALVDEAMARVRTEMESAYPLLVPLEVTVQSGVTWKDAH